MGTAFGAGSLAPLYEKEYRLFIIARFFYIMALRMVATVVAYKLFQLTRSSFSIGFSLFLFLDLEKTSLFPCLLLH